MLRRLVPLLVTSALAAAYIVVLPPSPLTVAGPTGPYVRGAIHVHTNRSDGDGSPADVAAAAAAAGLQFVILTDHGDATRAPAPPHYLDGVLVIDAVEISTTGGHVLGIGLPEAAPYPLGGEGRDAVEDIQRLGGVAIAAHIESPKPDLQWTDRDAPIDGLEWLNADSEWRDETAWPLLRALLAYPTRAVGAVASLLDRPDGTFARWDQLLRERQIVGVASVDAHARIGLSEPYDQRLALGIPSYETMFRTMSVGLASAGLSGDPAVAAATVIGAIRRGEVFSAIDGVAPGGSLRFSASSGVHTTEAGGSLPLGGPVILRIESNAPPDAQIVLVRNGERQSPVNGPSLEHRAPAEPAVFRVELRLPSAPGQPPVPWIVSNPIYVGRSQGPSTSPAVAPLAVLTTLFDDQAAPTLQTEQGSEGQAAFEVVSAAPDGRQLLFRYALGGRTSDSPYAAAAIPVPGIGDATRLGFTARADRPMRLAVQLRAPGGSEGQRWVRSVFLDQSPRAIDVAFSAFRPLAGVRSGGIPNHEIDTLLFVVDGVHTPLGSSGRVWLDDIRLGR